MVGWHGKVLAGLMVLGRQMLGSEGSGNHDWPLLEIPVLSQKQVCTQLLIQISQVSRAQRTKLLERRMTKLLSFSWVRWEPGVWNSFSCYFPNITLSIVELFLWRNSGRSTRLEFCFENPLNPIFFPGESVGGVFPAST